MIAMDGERTVLLVPTAARVGQPPITCYPGLVQPYKNTSHDGSVTGRFDSGTSVDRSCTTTTPLEMNQPRGETLCDPFSRYDDDLGEDHYYLMPAIRDSGLRNEWSRTVKNSRSLRTLKTVDVKLSDSKGRTRSFPPCGQRAAKNKFGGKSFTNDSGEYCSIANTAKAPAGLSTPLRSVKSLHGCKDRESLKDFASRLVVNDCNENQSSRQTLHSFDQRKTRAAWSATNDVAADNGRCGRSSCTMEDIIDYCTCMFCIKGLFYHCTKDSDGETIEDPCSCTGGARSSTGRVICLGLLSLFVPCIACYLPAKGCLRLCRSCKGTKHNKEHSVRYQKEMRRTNYGRDEGYV